MSFVKQGLVAGVVAGALLGTLASAQQSPSPTMDRSRKTPATATTGTMSRDATMKDIEKTLGFVPEMFKIASDAQLPSMWAAIKEFQVAETALDKRTKELIGLAVAAQIPCDYCVYFHTRMAKELGASEQQVKEAIGMSAVTRMASTVLNGSQLDVAVFRRDTDRLIKGSSDAKKDSTAASREMKR